ncbi:MAG: Sir2 family NAD-dependent protein deacetylase [Calditrichaceae bacterium]|jgi:NAD-dependent deacetylase
MFSETLLNRLKKAYQICVLTGQGLAAESGVATIRPEDGFWNNYDIAKLSTRKALTNNSEEFWKFYHAVRMSLKDIKPNLGHYSLVDLEQMFKRFYLITLNNDNLHRLAGTGRVAELNGNLARTRCTKCDFARNEDIKNYSEKGVLNCPQCGNILRPDVVLLDESVPQKTVAAVNQAAATSEVFISIGVPEPPKIVESLPFVAKGNGAYLLEISSGETELTQHTNEFLKGDSGKILPHLVTALTDS